MSDKLTWGILAAGTIAGHFARGVAASRTGSLLAVASRSQEKADKFADEHKIPRRYGTYEAMLADRDVQAVYIATPHPFHAEWAIRAAEAGKHVLCEKPIGLNHAEAMAVVEAAFENDVFLMEAYMYRCHPQTARLVELIRQKAIGDVRVIRAAFSFHARFNPEARLFSNALGGGGILDVGGYCTSMSRLIAGVAAGKDSSPAEPIEVKGFGHVGQTGVDEWAVASLRFPGDIVAQISAGVSIGMDNVVQVFGTEGNILVPNPWVVSREGGASRIVLKLNKEKEPREILVETKEFLYGIEADTVAASLSKGSRQAAPPAMTWDDTLGNMKTLDLWRAAIGQAYDAEQPERVLTAHRRPLAIRKVGLRPGAKPPAMTFGRIAGVDQPVSRLVMGCDNQTTMPHAAVMYDDFFERGGNCFDTAYVYVGAKSEKFLGQWVRSRGVRDKTVIIDKGSHTPFCTPKDLARQFNESLERLATDHVDVYLMHRDNPEVPVGEFIDVMNEFRSAGRMRTFGASNWTLGRFEAADQYARSKGVPGLAVLSNNLSLARMIEPPWAGCLTCSDEKWRWWLAKNQIPVLSWSSQARGFFTGRADPKDLSDKELVRCWYSEDNFRRLARANELAARRGVPTICIALAYVLYQPFPTFALIGPRVVSETRSSFQGLAVQLTADEVRWLNLET